MFWVGKQGYPPPPRVFSVYGTELWLVEGTTCGTVDGFCQILMLASMRCVERARSARLVDLTNRSNALLKNAYSFGTAASSIVRG